MGQLIVYEKPDTTLAIINPSSDGLAKYNNDLEAMATAIVPTGLTHHVISDTDFPTDTDFIDAWVWDGTAGKPKVDIAKARGVHLEKLKKLRKAKWKTMGVPENPHSAFDTNFDVTDTKTLTDLRALESYDLSTHTDPAILKADIPSYLI